MKVVSSSAISVTPQVGNVKPNPISIPSHPHPNPNPISVPPPRLPTNANILNNISHDSALPTYFSSSSFTPIPTTPRLPSVSFSSPSMSSTHSSISSSLSSSSFSSPSMSSSHSSMSSSLSSSSYSSPTLCANFDFQDYDVPEISKMVATDWLDADLGILSTL